MRSKSLQENIAAMNMWINIEGAVKVCPLPLLLTLDVLMQNNLTFFSLTFTIRTFRRI